MIRYRPADYVIFTVIMNPHFGPLIIVLLLALLFSVKSYYYFTYIRQEVELLRKTVLT